MKEFDVKIYWPGGYSYLEAVEAESREALQEFYGKAMKNKKDRTFTWHSSKMSVVINLDNVHAIEIVEATGEATTS